MSGQVFRCEYRVTYAHCTAGNHVYYSRYLDILEAARGEFFRHLGWTFLYWQERDTIFPVVECRLRYKGAACYDDVLTTELWLTEVEKVRLNFACRIMNPERHILVEGVTLHVCTSLHDKPKRLPEELRAALQAYLNVTAEIAWTGSVA
jgi:acyl-CoA thioester hydrolase